MSPCLSLQWFLVPGAPFPPPGPLGWVPRLLGTMERSDSPPPIPPHFVAFAWRYHRPLRFLPRTARSAAVRRSGIGVRLPLAGCFGGDDWASQVPVRPLGARTGSQTPAGPPAPRHARCGDAAFCVIHRIGSRAFIVSGLNHFARHAPCVRFAAPVARTPRNTRFRLVASLCRAGFSACWVAM